MKYTYFLKWSTTGMKYYGVRYANDCSPEDLWQSYFTSSTYVSKYIDLYGNPDIIQIRKTFEDSESALLWEAKFLKKVNAAERTDFLNKSNGFGKFDHMDPEIRAKKSMAATKWQKGKKKGPMSEARKAAISNALSGRTLSASHRENISKAQLGKKVSEETRSKMRGTRGKQKSPCIETTCPHCSLTGRGGNMKKYHFDNCKSKPSH